MPPGSVSDEFQVGIPPGPQGPSSQPSLSRPSLFRPFVLHSSQGQIAVLALLLVLATVALYNPIARAPFLNLDDDIYVTQNPEVRSGLTWHSIAWAFRTTTATNWHPITWLSHELDCQLFGLNPAGPHMVNVLLHAASAVLVFLLLAKATGAMWRSLMVAALFALHPMNAESVAWIAERKNVLSMFFFLLALGAYGWYARHPRLGRYLAVTALYALALMAKPQVITFPFALLLVDYWPLERFGGTGADEVDSRSLAASPARRTFFGLVREKIPWFALSAASALITLKAQSAAKHEELALWEHLANAALSYGRYLEKTFFPTDLAPMYPHPGRTISVPAAALSAIAIAAVTILAVIFRQRRYLFVGWFWFLGTLVPMIGLVQVGVQGMADRYAYIPLLGIFVIVVWGVADLARYLRVSIFVPVTASVLVLLALGFALHRQVSFWTDNFVLWRHTLDVTRDNFIAEDSAAGALLAQGKLEEALPYFRRAQAIRAGDPISALNIASYEQQHGDNGNAIELYGKVIELTSSPQLLALAHANRGYAYLALDEGDKAKQDFELALKEQSDYAPAYLGFGMLAQRAGDWAEAAQNFERAIKLQPTPIAYERLAEVLESLGQTEAANAARERAAKLASEMNRNTPHQ